MPNAFALCASSIPMLRVQSRHRPEKQTARRSGKPLNVGCGDWLWHLYSSLNPPHLIRSANDASRSYTRSDRRSALSRNRPLNPISTKGAFGQKRTSKITESGRSMALSTPSWHTGRQPDVSADYSLSAIARLGATQPRVTYLNVGNHSAGIARRTGGRHIAHKTDRARIS